MGYEGYIAESILAIIRPVLLDLHYQCGTPQVATADSERTRQRLWQIITMADEIFSATRQTALVFDAPVTVGALLEGAASHKGLLLPKGRQQLRVQQASHSALVQCHRALTEIFLRTASMALCGDRHDTPVSWRIRSHPEHVRVVVAVADDSARRAYELRDVWRSLQTQRSFRPKSMLAAHVSLAAASAALMRVPMAVRWQGGHAELAAVLPKSAQLALAV